MRIRKQFLEVPLPLECGLLRAMVTRIFGALLAPLYLAAASYLGAPGTGFHLRCIAHGLRLFLTGRTSLRTCYTLLFTPMDSTRYFEFHEVWQQLGGFAGGRYLDISSPRLAPLLLLKESSAATAEFINPDSSDIQRTELLVAAFGLQSRCRLHCCVLEQAPLELASFDLITSISVLEHIPDDRGAISTMWNLLRPGGRLVLTLPCMSQPLEQYISDNQYGVLKPGEDGYTFWQRYYDPERLASSIFSITGMPKYSKVYGERTKGSFLRNATMKRLMGHRYPFWREPYMMAREYRYFNAVEELPGEGVIYLEFVKP